MLDKPVWKRLVFICFDDVSYLNQRGDLPSIQSSFPSKETGLTKEVVKGTLRFTHDCLNAV